MPGNSDIDKLAFLAMEAGKEGAWLEFSRFCEFRGRGVRAAAMEHLNNFLQAAVPWSLEKRLTFSKWVLWRAVGNLTMTASRCHTRSERSSSSRRFAVGLRSPQVKQKLTSGSDF